MTNGTPGPVLQGRLAYNQYGGYCLPVSSLHRPAAQAILSGGIWEPDTIAFLTSHSVRGDLVHAGTYFGDFLPALANSRVAGEKVWAFEPNHENYRCASITVAINGLVNVVLTHAALGGRTGNVVLAIRGEDGSGLGGTSRVLSDFDIARIDKKNMEETQTAILDAILPKERPISIIQLDVEGFETPALDGAMETIRRWLPVIVVETMPSHEWLCEHLWPLAYRVGKRVHDNTVLAPAHVGG